MSRRPVDYWLTPPKPRPDGRRAPLLQHLSSNLLKLVPVAAVVVAGLVVVMLALPGCPPGKPIDEPVGQPDAKLGRIPEIRILVHDARKVPLATTGGYRLLADGREIARSDRPLGKTLSRSGRHWYLGQSVYMGSSLTLEAGPDSLIVLNDGRYRGRIVLHPKGPNDILCVNHVDVERYLAGVLRRELFPQWDLKAYQAQAIAARTYALYQQAVTGADKVYDVKDDQSSQVYGGADAETPKSRQAVADTHGIVLATGAEGDEKIFSAHYSSSCGGMTNNVAVLYGKTVTEGPLVGGVTCRDCSGSKQYRWAVLTIPKKTVHRSLARQKRAIAAMPAIKTIEPRSAVHGRTIWIDVVGTKGRRVRIRAEDLRLALLRNGQGKGLYSMNCTIRVTRSSVIFGSGRGYGHGVGMCQWGMQGMAARGLSPQQILAHYYPNSKLFQAYR